MNREALENAIRFCDSYTRLAELIDLYDPSKANADWFQVLGENLTTCDNVWQFRVELVDILGSASSEHIALMMTQEERDALAQLPDQITVYRGCFPWNADGFSWSLSREVAAASTTLNRYRHDDHEATIRTATVNKCDCVLKLDREEQEVICWSLKDKEAHL